MKKVALVFGLFVLTLYSCGKQDSVTRPKNYHTVSYTVNDKTSKDSQNEKSLVQLQNAGMSQMNFSSLQEALGKIDIANYAIESNTQIVLIETLNHNINVKGFNKMIDDFNLLYASDNEVLMQNYQSFADVNCKKIYGCVGTVNDADYDWKIIKFLPNPEKCTFEPTITMSNVMLYK
jgi:hypothetical protein